MNSALLATASCLAVGAVGRAVPAGIAVAHMAMAAEPDAAVHAPLHAEPDPTGYGRKKVNDELDKIRRFRNRINHNEPICFRGNNIDFTETIEVYNSIINLLTWIDPEIVKLISDIDKVKEIVANAKTI